MGFALVIVGLLMIVTGGRGTYQQFGSLVASEFQGENNFTYWLLSLGSVGALGYIDSLRTISRLLMTLIIIVLFLSHKGFFTQFNAALKQGPKPPASVDQPSSSSATNPKSQGYVSEKPWLDLGSLGSINPQLTPGSWSDKLFQMFGGKSQ